MYIMCIHAYIRVYTVYSIYRFELTSCSCGLLVQPHFLPAVLILPSNSLYLSFYHVLCYHIGRVLCVRNLQHLSVRIVRNRNHILTQKDKKQ
jgi:hypothetical protein